jgi:Zn finger protein HypA/HybF involved in hydrogenase expression
MPKIGCQHCGLVLEVQEPEPALTRSCPNCAATMRPLTSEDAKAIKSASDS